MWPKHLEKCDIILSFREDKEGLYIFQRVGDFACKDRLGEATPAEGINTPAPSRKSQFSRFAILRYLAHNLFNGTINGA